MDIRLNLPGRIVSGRAYVLFLVRVDEMAAESAFRGSLGLRRAHLGRSTRPPLGRSGQHAVPAVNVTEDVRPEIPVDSR